MLYPTVLLPLLAARALGAAVYSGEPEMTEGQFATALKTEVPVVTAAVAAPPNLLTIRVVNKAGMALSTKHMRAVGSPPAASGNVAPGRIAAGATAAFAVPTNWIGSVAVKRADNPITNDDSLIEGNFVRSQEYGVAIAGIDVSYVNGFTVPIVCSCNGRVVTGCNKPLWDLGTCGKNNGKGSCVNPERYNTAATKAPPFFRPCAGDAYTFPSDSEANSWRECQVGLITCCVGTNCPRNPTQS